jgi:RHS repeat-associated protein
VRHADGTTVTDKLYTGQQQEVEIGLSYYIARFYDPVIAHFIQADSVIPHSALGYRPPAPQAWWLVQQSISAPGLT